MRTRTFSVGPLLVGLVVGLFSLWVSAAPVGATGDLVTGGLSICSDQYDDMMLTTADDGDCDPCSGTTTGYCSDNGCSGGSVSVVVAALAGATPHASSRKPCWGNPTCLNIHNGSCY